VRWWHAAECTARRLIECMQTPAPPSTWPALLAGFTEVLFSPRLRPCPETPACQIPPSPHPLLTTPACWSGAYRTCRAAGQGWRRRQGQMMMCAARTSSSSSSSSSAPCPTTRAVRCAAGRCPPPNSCPDPTGTPGRCVPGSLAWVPWFPGS